MAAAFRVSIDCRAIRVRPNHLLPSLILVAACAWLPRAACADDAKPYPRISEEAFKARLGFFDYDKAIPLEGRVAQQWDQDNSVRQKIVFRGAQGFRVPGQIEFPKAAPKPCPLVFVPS